MPFHPFPDGVTRPIVSLLVINGLPENPEPATAEASDDEQVRFLIILMGFSFYMLDF
jgi:hypothetical protein